MSENKQVTPSGEVGPVYGAPLIDALPLGDCGMMQAMPTRQDLQRTREVSERTAAGYEVLLSHYLAAAEQIAIIDMIRNLGEGWLVEIITDNPDPETKDQQCGIVIWSDFRTTEEIYLGETVLDALRKGLDATMTALLENRNAQNA